MKTADTYTVPYYDQAQRWANTLDSYHYAQVDKRIRLALIRYGIDLPADQIVDACAHGKALLVHEWKFATRDDYRAIVIISQNGKQIT